MRDNQLIKGVMHTMMFVIPLMLGSSQPVYAANTLHDAIVFDLFCGNTESILQLLTDENCESDVRKIEEEKGSLLTQVVRLEGVNELELVNLIVQLVAHGADVNKQDSDGNTPLYYAVQRNSIELTRALLYRGADPNVQNKLGWTPLHKACYRGGVRLVQLLVSSSKIAVDINLKNGVGKNGETAYELAKRKGHIKVVEVLENNVQMGNLSRSRCFVQ